MLPEVTKWLPTSGNTFFFGGGGEEEGGTCK